MSGPTFGKRVKSLTNMDYDEVSLVDVPANQHAAVMIAKRHTQGAEMPDLTTEDMDLFDHEGFAVDTDELRTGDVVYDEDANPYEYTAPEDMELEPVGKGLRDHYAVQGIARGARRTANSARSARGRRAARSGDKDSVVGNNGRAITGTPGGSETSFSRRTRAADGARRAGPAARNAAADVRQAVRNTPGAGLAIGGGAGGAAVYGHERHVNKSFAEEISKALSEATSDSDRDYIIEEFAKAYDAQQSELDELANIAKSERDLRLESQYVEVAKNLGLPGDPDELGPVLKRMSDLMDPADVEVIAKTLDGVSGILYEEIGYGGFGAEAGDPNMADAEAAAEARISKANGVPAEVSKAAGIEEYYSSNPDAYEQYMAARR